MFVIAIRPQTRSDIEQVSTLDRRRRIDLPLQRTASGRFRHCLNVGSDLHNSLKGNVVGNVGSDLHNSLMFKDNIKKEPTIFLLKARFSLRNCNVIPTGDGIQEGFSTPLPKYRP